MKVNIDRSKLMVKALRDRVDNNKEFFQLVTHYKQKFNMKPLQLNPRNLDYWLCFRSPDANTPRFIEQIILEKQKPNFELAPNIEHNKKVGSQKLAEFMPKTLNKLFKIQIDFKSDGFCGQNVKNLNPWGSSHSEFKSQLNQAKIQNYLKL